MSRNRRKNANTVRVATFFWWLLVFVGLSGLGLCYVSIKNQTIAFGEQRRVLERDLRDLNEKNRAFSSQVTALTSRSALQKQLNSGFIKLVEIDSTQIVRLGANTRENIVTDSITSTQILAQK